MKKLSLFIGALFCSVLIISCKQEDNNIIPIPVSNIQPTQAYIANWGNSTISICNVESTGVLTACIESNLDGLIYKPNSIATSGNYIYIGNDTYGSSRPTALTVCSFINGIIRDCFNTESSAYDTNSAGISINNEMVYFTSNRTYAYICSVTGSTISDCVKSNNTANLWGGPVNFTLNHIYSINNYQNSINVCSTSFTNCTITNTDRFLYTSGMVINSTATFAYVITRDNNFIDYILNYCSINSITGLFDSCNSINPKLSLIDLNLDTVVPAIYSNVLFVPNDGSDTISICPIADNGSVKTCTASTMKKGNNPVAIYIKQPSN